MPMTNGSGSRRPKNIRIRIRIRISSTRLHVPELVADLAKQLIVVIRGALLALSHLQAQDLLVDVNLKHQNNKLPEMNIHISLLYFLVGIFYFFSYDIQHCFICRPSDSTVPTDAGIEPRTVATGALAVNHVNH
jgi:hypothetical protein